MRGLYRTIVLLLAACPAYGEELPAQATATEAIGDVGVGSTGEARTGWLTTATNGYLDVRQSYTHVATDHLLPANGTPTLHNLTEGNVQLKLRWTNPVNGREWGEGLADASFVYQRGGRYFGLDATGAKQRVPDHGAPTSQPLAVLSEFYGTWHASEHLHLTLGKKRVVWGPGLTINPTDLLNPPKDPSDPTLQRAGAWLARVEAPFETWTLTGLFAAKVTRQFAGLPQGLVFHPDFDTAADHHPHFAAAIRAYALWHETDLNAIGYLTQRYNDDFEWKPRFGLSASHVFWNAVELHVEALGQTGSARRYPVSKLEDGKFRPRVLAGARYMFGDAASVTAEYLFQGDGYTSEEFDQVMTRAKLLTSLGINLPQTPQDGSPQRFSFDPLRRHYALVSYQQSQIADDWSVLGLILMDLEDFSGTVAPTVMWSAQEWLALTASGFVTLPGLASRGGLTPDGTRHTEYASLPLDWRIYASARLYY